MLENSPGLLVTSGCCATLLMSVTRFPEVEWLLHVAGSASTVAVGCHSPGSGRLLDEPLTKSVESPGNGLSVLRPCKGHPQTGIVGCLHTCVPGQDKERRKRGSRRGRHASQRPALHSRRPRRTVNSNRALMILGRTSFPRQEED